MSNRPKCEVPCNDIGTKGPSYKKSKRHKRREETVRDADANTEMSVQDTHKSQRETVEKCQGSK